VLHNAGGMRRAVVILLSFCVAAAFASSSFAKPAKPVFLKFTTGSFVVTCTSSGQVCAPDEPLTFTLPRGGTLTKVVYTTPKTHCSAVRVFVRLKGKTVAKLPRLDAGDATGKIETDVKLKKGTNTLGFRAKGFVGGCNAGVVRSWGGKVTVTVKLD
jgi:hypothetical protein